MRAGRVRRQSGFTLLEVIIAFMLLALALTLLLGALSGGARQIRTADTASKATLHAQTLLAQLGVGETLQPGRSEGIFGDSGYAWSLEVAPYVDPLQRPGTLDPGAMRLMQLRLVVAWGEAAGQQMQWQTLRLVPLDVNVPLGSQ